MLVFCLGLALVIALWVRKVRGAILISIVVTTVVAVVVEAIGRAWVPRRATTPRAGRSACPPSAATSSTARTSTPSASSTCSAPSADAGTGVLAALLLVFSLLLADFFDTMGTMTAIGAEAGLQRRGGHPPNAQRILVVDSVAAIAGGAAGVSSNTSYIESASGVGEGARTGLASVVTGVLFLLATFFTPLVAVIPSRRPSRRSCWSAS